MLKKPWLIQRCDLREGRLGYDYMGAAEFEVGDQSKSLKRIFAKGICNSSVAVEVNGREVKVYMVAGDGFAFAEYQPYLQQLADNNLRLQERTNFADVLNPKAGIKSGRRFIQRTNTWFDFQNDVLWTLTEDDQKNLISVLEGIKRAWAAKALEVK